MIKFVFRWAFRLVLLALVLVIGLFLLKDNIARNLTEERIRRETGFDAKIGKMQFSLFSPRVTLENLIIYNPAEFGGSIFLNAPDLHIEYDRKQLALGKLHLTLLRLSLTEFHIVENQHGRTNLIDVLSRTAPELLGSPAGTSAGYKFAGIDMLNLSIDQVRYTNLRVPKRNQEVKLAVRNDLTRNIRTEQDVTAILFKILLRAGITFYADHPKPSKVGATNAPARK
ncbi:MAG TPA: hypothetical protein VM735_12625 [Candidatus Kapabacteria bacterium]|nr:hypothetical protein [Candidatus Kapabacteria bacterium]